MPTEVFTAVVLALLEVTDEQDARWAAGQATMRLPDGSFDETFKLAVQTLRPMSRSASA